MQQAFLLPVGAGECFCVYRRPEGPVDAGTILHLPAFGDEMNKARAMTAAAARAFAARGFGVLQVDFLGCGDSSGDHGEATLAAWIDNARCAIDWLREESDVRWLWCLRAGALLAPRLLAHAVPAASLLLWQPMLTGAQQLTQLLRQKAAADLLSASADRAGTKALRERLHDGETLEVGGYAICAAMARELEAATFALPASFRGRIAWFEVSSGAQPTLSPAASARIEALRADGCEVAAAAIEGPGFWQSVEIERCDALIESSLCAMETERANGVSRDAVVL